MTRRHHVLLAGAVPIALAMSFAAPQAAFAREAVRLTTDGKTTHTAGHAVAKVVVSFPSRRAYDVRGWVSDRCPGDGYGAYVYVERAESGPAGGMYSDRRRVGTDANGCGNGRSHFDPGPVKYSSRLGAVRIHLCEWDASEGGAASCTWKSVSNWRND